MPKLDKAKNIDLRGGEGGGSVSGDFLIADNVDRVDGFHAFATPRPGALLALGLDGKFPVSALPLAGSSQITGHHGVQYFGPTAYLVEALTATAESILVSAPAYGADDSAAISWVEAGDGVTEHVWIVGGGEQDGRFWRYPIARAKRGTSARDFPAGATVVSLGSPTDGGHISVDSASSGDSPYIQVRQNNEDRSTTWKMQIGKLSTVPQTFRDKFPNVDASVWDTFSFAGENLFLSGYVYADGGSFNGDIDLTGTITVAGPGNSTMEIGETVGGWGIGLRSATGRPLIQMLAPFVDESGNVISDVAFVIDNNGFPGLYYGQVEGTDNYRLDISVDTLVRGTFRSGERILVGVGEWEGNFSGIAIDSQYGFVGLGSDDTFDTEPGDGTYQTWWDRSTGKFFLAQGIVVFDEDGITLRHASDARGRDTIKWFSPAYDMNVMELGLSPGANTAFWITINSDGTESKITHSPDEGMDFYLPSGQAFSFYSGGELLFILGGPGDTMTLRLPLTLHGSNTFVHWAETGWMGIGTYDPQATLHISHPSGPQLRLAQDNDNYADFYIYDGNTWVTTTGDMILGPGSDDIVPMQPFTVSLGSPFRRFLAVYAAELNVETLVAQEKIATIGGSVMIAPTTKLAFDLPATGTKVYTEHNQAAVDDILVMQDASGGSYVIEYVRVVSGPVAAGDYYEYTVTRDIDGTGANAWAAGAALVNTGQEGDGFINLYSEHGLDAPSKYGPTITGNVRTGTAHNDIDERWAIGNLNGVYGYATTTYGAAFGEHGGVWISIDDTNGFRIHNSSGVVGQWGIDNSITLTDDRTLDDIPDGSVYGRLLAGDIDAGHLLLSAATGDLDDIDNGTTYGRVKAASLSAAGLVLLDQTVNGTYGKVLTTSISAGKILLSQATGSLDNIANGTTYGKVLNTAISAGKISLTSGVVGTLPAGNTEATVGATWGTNLNSIPIRFADSPTSSGLYLTTTALGYWDSTLGEWRSYFDDSGNFFLNSGAGSGNYIGMSTTDATYRLWIGHSTASSALFRVTKTGYVYAASGQIGGWYTTSSTFYSASGSIILDAANNRLTFGSYHWVYDAVYGGFNFSGGGYFGNKITVNGDIVGTAGTSKLTLGVGSVTILTQTYLSIQGAGSYVDVKSGYRVNGTVGVSGTWTTTDGKTITASGGIITSIV